MKILNIYSEFKNIEPTFLKWKEEQDLRDKKTQAVVGKKPVTKEVLLEQKRAKILTNALTSIDEYAQTKAEDIDSVSQTLLYIAVGTLGTIGTFIGKKLASFSKSTKIQKTLPSAMGVGLALAAFLPFVKTTVVNQVRANRIARFDGVNSDKLFHINDFAVLTPEQEKEVQSKADKISDKKIENQESIINRANIFNSVSVFKDFTMKQSEFAYRKKEFDKKLKENENNLKDVQFNENDKKQAEKDKNLFNKILKNVDIEAHYPLERIEKGVNVAYSSMFAGGVLEYLVSDGILNLLNVKNKIVRPVLSFGLPVLTIMSLNKQLANFLNDAVKAVRYKKMQEFLNNPDNFKEASKEEIDKAQPLSKETKKTGYIEFLKQTLKDIDDYKKYQQTSRIKEKKFALAQREIKLTPKQKADAELLKRNTEVVINTLDDQTQKYASAMETITESTTIPLDIVAPIVGTFTADKMHKAISPKGHFGLLYKGLGVLIAFLPAALSEIYFVGKQRSAKRCATMIASTNLQNPDKFLDTSKKEKQIKSTVANWHFCSNVPEKSKAFLSFKKDFSNKDFKSE